jgi:flagellar basal body-associated protein FliL
MTMAGGAHQAEEKGMLKKTLYIILFIVLFLAAGGMMLYGMVTLAAALIHW